MLSAHFEIDGISIEVTRKRMKNLLLSIRRTDGQVRVSAPLRLSLGLIQSFVVEKLPWIKLQRARLSEAPKRAPFEFKDQELHLSLGQEYSLRVLDGVGNHQKKGSVTLSGQEMILSLPRKIPSGGTRESVAERVLETYYREVLAKIAQGLIQKWEPRLQVRVNALDVRRMKSKWGSCHIFDRKIRLNSELARLRPELVEYVMVHEMIHLLEPSHNARFKSLMDQFLPQWREFKSELGKVLLGRNQFPEVLI